MKYPSFVNGSYPAQSWNADKEHTVNMVVERNESEGATGRDALYPFPGVTALDTRLPLLSSPVAPSITQVGTPGATEYAYMIVAFLADGSHSANSGGGATLTGPLTPSVVDFNRITWPAVTNAAYYGIYLLNYVTSLNPAKFVATTTATTYDHTELSLAVDAEVPQTNTTGIPFVPQGAGRGHFFENGREFAIFGDYLYEISEEGEIITPRGSVQAGFDPATIFSNGDGGGQLLITSGGNAYSYDLATNVLTQIAALTGIAVMGNYLDGYGLVLGPTNIFYVSALLDFTSWTIGTDFAQRSAASDSWVSMTVLGIYIALLGSKTTEFWYDTGGASFPFAKHPSGGPIPYGCVAPFSVAVGEGSLFWLAQSAIGKNYVVRTSGFTAEVVSDFPRQRLFAAYPTAEDAVAELVNWNGHMLYEITFQRANITWAFDMTSSKWVQKGPWIAESNKYAASRTRSCVVAFGQHRCLDSETGAVYVLDPDSHEDVDGRPLVCERTAPALVSENELIFYSSLELDIQVGVGLTTGQGEEPQVMLQYSNDGGNTWSAELWRSLGKVGEYQTRVRWDALGSARRRVFRIRISDPVQIGIVGAYLTLGQPLRAQQQGAA